jgi:hypothetical protein
MREERKKNSKHIKTKHYTRTNIEKRKEMKQQEME